MTVEDAIKTLNDYITTHTTTALVALAWETVKREICKNRTKYGYWTVCEDGYGSFCECSLCGYENANYDADEGRTEYCPGCGAKMIGVHYAAE